VLLIARIGKGLQQLLAVDLEEHLRHIRQKRWQGKPRAEKVLHRTAHASRAFWDALSPAGRSAIMKERAKKRRRR
jgi:hypothetical protein